MTRPRVVAIDGAAGGGKSTLARSLTVRLGVPYVNTGLMYRAVTAAALRHGASLDDAGALASLADGLRFTLTNASPPELEVEGYDIATLTTPAVEGSVSAVARHRDLRTRLRAVQRTLGETGAVMEGRDIGSVVFPDAPVKLFLAADPGTRAARRVAERDDAGAGDALHVRDSRDARTTALEPVGDAHVIDTTERDAAAVLADALAIVAREASDVFPGPGTAT